MTLKIPENYSEFEYSLDHDQPPGLWPESLQALWWEGKGSWANAHNIAQDIHSNIGNWIHAYLHRKEGDEWNAGYWYQRAGLSFPTKTLEEEFRDLVLYIIDQLK